MSASESKYPLPSRPGIVLVSYEMAGDWLDHRNHPKNRRISMRVVRRYADDMKADRWKLTPEGLLFDTDGLIISAQHRLAALRLAQLSELPFWVFPDQPRDIFAAVDQGFKRNAAQVLQVAYPTQVAAAAKYVAGDGNVARNLARINTIGTQETLTTIREWPELTWHSEQVWRIWRRTHIAGAALVAVTAQAERTAHRHRIPAWLNALETGADLSATDPRWQLRERFIGISRPSANSGAGRTAAYSLIAKAWNLYATNSTTSTLRWMVTEQIPVIVGLANAA